MLKVNIQLFAHKKGVSSTKNGRDSESKRLGVKRADGQFVLAGKAYYPYIHSLCDIHDILQSVIFLLYSSTIVNYLFT